MLFSRRILSPAGLSAVKSHRYVAGAGTFGDALLAPWWRFVARCAPGWLS
jgi:hypothetical protein